MQDLVLVLRYTRHWIHYGFFAHIGLCVLAAAAQGVISAVVGAE